MEPRSEIPGDKSRVSLVIVWFLYLAAVLSVCARLGTKYGMARRLGADDVLIIIAQATSLAQCIAISFAANLGLGASMNDLFPGQIDEVLKAEYASTPFLLLTLALVKWSICVFISHLSPNAIHRHVDLAFRLTIGLWLVSATVISVFQCGLPKPWDYIHRNSCTDRRAWWTYASVANMITELGFVVLYVWIIGRLHISVLKRTTVLLVFLTRLFVIGAAAAQLAMFWTTYSTQDITAGLWLPTVCNQVVIFLSVLTACLPYLRPLMESLESGIVHVPDEVEELRSFARAGSRSTWLSSPS